MALSEAARSLWAKSDQGGGWHPLIAHLLDVAACAEAILEREPPSTLALYAEDFKLPPNEAKVWVCALAGLHDIGKASPAFQQKWPEGKERVWKIGLTWKVDPTPPPQDVPHGVISHGVLTELLEDAGWAYPACQHAADAVGAHHGFRASPQELSRVEDYDYERGVEAWDDARRELFSAVLATLGVQAPPTLQRLSGAAFERLAGLTSFADWIGSSLSFAPFDGDPDTYYQHALGRARQALNDIGWRAYTSLSPAPPALDEVFAYLGSAERPFKARALQARVEELVGDNTHPTLLLIEAPMGEGKTEAAFYAHLCLQAALDHRGMYVALPTQATGNAMFVRTADFLRRMGRATPPDLQLLHGASQLNELYRRIQVRPNTAEEREEGVIAQSWFTQRKRALLSEYGVGTVDQALVSILNAKHQFVRLWGLANRTVIIDEVHAYDTYTSDLITSLVRWLHALGSSVVLMSATLPDSKRRTLLEAFGAREVPSADYPCVTKVADGAYVSRTFTGRQQPEIALERASQDIATIAAKLRTLTSAGGCAACIVNTVQRAQELYLVLKEEAPPDLVLCLFHARYPIDERQRRERWVLTRFGKRSALGRRRPRKAILVATQVVEQSLDLDFDVMITDLAPIDLVLQRAGRLHRHDRKREGRYGHDTPTLYVAGLETESELPDLSSPFWDRLYEPYVLLKTWLALRQEAALRPPGDIDRLVQKVYEHDDWLQGQTDSVLDKLEQHRAAMVQRDNRDEHNAFYAVFGHPHETKWLDQPNPIKVWEDPDIGADDDRPLLRTRQGQPNVTVIPLFRRGDAYYLDRNYAQRVSLHSKLEPDEAKRLYARSLRISRYEIVSGIKDHVRAHGLPQNVWSQTPLLTRSHPLIFTDGEARFGTLRVYLDPELGLVFEKSA